MITNCFKEMRSVIRMRKITNRQQLYKAIVY
ncbi:Uncharacterised protein [Vibrio cholerae]|nr:Uncharacterised protein [Vibrio cholerae]